MSKKAIYYEHALRKEMSDSEFLNELLWAMDEDDKEYYLEEIAENSDIEIPDEEYFEEEDDFDEDEYFEELTEDDNKDNSYYSMKDIIEMTRRVY